MTARERSIVFGDAMIRAIAEGRKTQTRRAVLPQPILAGKVWTWPRDGPNSKASWADFIKDPSLCMARFCPYGQPGDRLWVRETYCLESNREITEQPYDPPFADGRPVRWVDDPDWGRYWEQPHYRATDPKPELAGDWDGHSVIWTPSIFMPRWASRWLLEITDVRVQRVQDIDEEDVSAEGVTWTPANVAKWRHPKTPQMAYAGLWDSLNSKLHQWDKNPLVWAIKFNVNQKGVGD